MAVHDAYDPPDARGTARRVTSARLPRPSTRTRVRKEVVLRPATPADAAACVLVDGTYSTSHIWQLDTRQDTDELRICFRRIRLPRELTLIAPHRPPSLPPGATSAQRRGQLWLVAEEVETDGQAPGGPHDSLPATASWSHAVRRSGSASSVQLSLPPLRPGDESDGRRDRLARRASPVPGVPQPIESPMPIPLPPPGRSRVPTGTAGTARIVGYVVATAASRERNAYLGTLVIDRAYRRQGIASRFLAEVKRWAVQQGADRLIADAQARNYPALRLLQKAGLTFCGFNDCCYGDHEVAVFLSARLR